YKEQLRPAPISVLVDPQRVREIVVQDSSSSFPTEVAYIFDQQLREADAIVLTKTDTLDPNERDGLLSKLQNVYHKPVLHISAHAGEGMDAWLALLTGSIYPGANVLRNMDYAVYAAGEAALGWLNATIEVSDPDQLNADRLFCAIMNSI